MRRLTTPQHDFMLTDVPAAAIAKLRVTYAQKQNVILEKTEADAVISADKITVRLTQDETALFESGTVKIQLRVLTTAGDALASPIYTVNVDDVLNGEVL